MTANSTSVAVERLSLEPISTQCDVCPVCVPIELLATSFNLPQPNVMLVQYRSPIKLVETRLIQV